MSKTIAWVIAIIIVVGAAGYFMTRSSAPSAAPADTGAAAQGNSANNTSDAQLQSDLSASDAAVQSAGSAGVSASTFSDTPVAQTE